MKLMHTAIIRHFWLLDVALLCLVQSPGLGLVHSFIGARSVTFMLLLDALVP